MTVVTVVPELEEDDEVSSKNVLDDAALLDDSVHSEDVLDTRLVQDTTVAMFSSNGRNELPLRRSQRENRVTTA